MNIITINHPTDFYKIHYHKNVRKDKINHKGKICKFSPKRRRSKKNKLIIMKKEKFDYHIFPPFVDAYENSFYDHNRLTIDEIKKIMGNYAAAWSNEVVENSKHYGKNIPTYKDKIVLCCGEPYTGKPFKVYDENYNLQKGVKQCGDCHFGVCDPEEDNLKNIGTQRSPFGIGS